MTWQSPIGETRAASVSVFRRSFQAYSQWKNQLANTIEEYRSWLKTKKQCTSNIDARIDNTLTLLEKDRLTVAVVAEVSRGKTELINAIFFADYGRRLLPSAAGRTTMCPTELLWDMDRKESYVRLLPIETRGQDETINELKRKQHSNCWIDIPLNVKSPDQIESTLREIIQTKQVTDIEAKRLGLFNPQTQQEPKSDMIEVPRWRHAIISFPHPLLKQGLVILDTPGLNALGNEPELTISTLPNAQVILFVLAADTGVTRSDMEMWQHYIQGPQKQRQRGLIIALNKIDALWDELKFPQEVRKIIADQRTMTAKTLGLDEQLVFPLSAQKALVGRVKNDPTLLVKSAIVPLESYLGDNVLAMRQQIILETIEQDIGQLIEASRTLVAQQIRNIKQQLSELESLRDKSADVIKQMLEKTRLEQAQYIEAIDKFQNGRLELKKWKKQLHQQLNLKQIDSLITKTYDEMLASWTTHGMSWAMKTLFDELRYIMQQIIISMDETKKLIRDIYRNVQRDLNLTTIHPPKFSTMQYRVNLEVVYQEVDVFRRSPTLTISSQGFVVKRFYSALAGRGREVFEDISKVTNEWLSQALDPLITQIQEYKDAMEKRLANLKKIGNSKNTLDSRIADLESQYVDLARQLTTLRNMYNNIRINPSNSSQ